MLSTFLMPEAMVFAVCLAVVAGLFILEILTALLGGTLLGIGSDAPDLDLDADFDFSAEVADGGGLAVDDVGPDLETGGAGTSGLFTWIGARDVPFLIWLVSFLTTFGLFGLILQSLSTGIFGAPLPAILACVIAFVPALGVTRVIANWVALIMPKTETTAVRARHLGGCHGTVTQGTASRGKPAEVKIRDRHGNIHYLRVEPLRDDETFEQGSDVTLIRKRGDKFFVI
ncbi:YqiJ family protein [Rhodobacter sp. NTK016B]|uniref:YqiJ family protein n=1 Tax=Rhodobacter sp. NTK016B TaxID=2759676 RepID=UPI001A8F9076|nr:YqiJ family protein [Rhodobacter sp. NTK016B]MBN8291005.1 YqiJ family protein [Rhodobacter sp. NTK016B]